MKSSKFLSELKNLKHFKDIEISSLHLDSRSLTVGGLFFAIKGHDTDGGDYIDSAIENGAVLIVSDNERKKDDKNVIYFKDLRKYIGLFSSRFYNNPSSQIKTICVTGTNGKTTTVETLSSISNLLGMKSGYMSTISSSLDGNHVEESTLTTPNPIHINSFLQDAIENDIKLIAMEASSHGLDQNRLSGIEIDYAILTSFSQDHLDYHGSLENYKEAKRKLFLDLSPINNIICIDSDFGESLYRDLKILNKNTFSVSIKKEADFQATFKDSEIGLDVSLKALNQELHFKLGTISRYLASNIICSLAVLALDGRNLKDIASISTEIKLPPGRLEAIHKDNNIVYIDYAHTPEALEYALREVKRRHKGSICCLFGCGGERDEQKRSLMGGIAEKYSDKLILTNDNPRNEDQNKIINDILSGIKLKKDILIELNREKAIKKALKDFRFNDEENVLLIAGKGHESYQEIKNERNFFNDKNVVNEILKKI